MPKIMKTKRKSSRIRRKTSKPRNASSKLVANAQAMSSGPLDTEQVLRATMAKLTAAMNSIELHGDGEHDSTIKGLARISEALVRTSDGLRQIEKHRRRQLAEFSLDEISAYIAELPKKKRDEVFTNAFVADAEEPLLS